MNETELRRRLNGLGLTIALNEEKNGIWIAETTGRELPAQVRAAIGHLEDQLVRRELHLTAWEFVAEKLTKHCGPGLHPAAIVAFGDAGRHEQLCQTWATGTLNDFKATLRAGIDAAIDAPLPPDSPSNDPTQPPQPPSTEQQLPFA